MDQGTLERVILPHTLDPPSGLVECASVLDVGSGVRPFVWYRPVRHTCVEPYGPYCDVLRDHGHLVLQMTAVEALADHGAEAVLLLDVIEHMERDIGEQVLAMARRAATRQVVVYTPNGFLFQDGDPWGYGGHEWQRHRSGWVPGDFPGWMIQLVNGDKAFFAIWNHP